MSRLVGRARRASSRAEFEEAAGNVARLVAAHGSPSQVAAEAETILRDSDASLASLYSLKTTIDSITSNGWDESSIQLDLSFVKGMAYYTGAVFEFLPPNKPTSPSPSMMSPLPYRHSRESGNPEERSGTPSPLKGEGWGEGDQRDSIPDSQPRSEDPQYALGGGGRYDDLVKAFGGPDMPACGFALNIDELAWAARHNGAQG